MVGSWEPVLQAWQHHMIAMNISKDTRYLRLRYAWRLAHQFPAGHQSVTAFELVAWVASFEHWKPSTRRSAYSSWRALWRWLIETDQATSSPAHKLPSVKMPRAKPRPAPEEDFALALSIADRRVRLALMLAGYCGMRRGEISRARREDMEMALDGWTLRVTGKGGHVRVIPLPDEIVREIKRVKSGWLFPSTRERDQGRPLSAWWIGRLVTRHLPRDLTTHTLRHRCGTVAYAGSKDLRAVQELLGHSKPETTAIYVAVPPEDIRAAMQHAAVDPRLHLRAVPTDPPAGVPTEVAGNAVA